LTKALRSRSEDGGRRIADAHSRVRKPASAYLSWLIAHSLNARNLFALIAARLVEGHI